MGREVDGEVEGVNLGTAVFILVREGIVTRFRVGLSMPFETFAGALFDAEVLRMVDSQAQCNNGVATHRVGEGLSIVARLGVGGVIPGITFAFHDGEFRTAVVVDGEVERIDLRTAIFVAVSVNIGAGGGVGLSVPLEALTGNF